ncbi:unnamed protein product [Danaus chrysippus]|uniref:(African queen) hypothetical protein n=1 Tax=Danaus chrysippus TaxID=151541 RepID=A0A8J2VX36_9NEOP|nr:unnamed protein product [Danaus chrysippus]
MGDQGVYKTCVNITEDQGQDELDRPLTRKNPFVRELYHSPHNRYPSPSPCIDVFLSGSTAARLAAARDMPHTHTHRERETNSHTITRNM